MRAGRLLHRVSIRKYLEIADGHDGFTEAAVTVQARISAEVVPLAGRDLERARQIDPRAAHRLTLRYWRTYQDDLAGGRVQVIWHDGVRDRTLEVIEPPREVVHRDILEMTCREAA